VCLQNCEKQILALSCLSVWLAVHPHGKTQFPLHGFLLDLILEFFLKICKENASFISTCQEEPVLYTETNIHFFKHTSLSSSQNEKCFGQEP
jgi:hypothetical protein